jgi:hypothetical protein
VGLRKQADDSLAQTAQVCGGVADNTQYSVQETSFSGWPSHLQLHLTHEGEAHQLQQLQHFLNSTATSSCRGWVSVLHPRDLLIYFDRSLLLLLLLQQPRLRWLSSLLLLVLLQQHTPVLLGRLLGLRLRLRLRLPSTINHGLLRLLPGPCSCVTAC